MKADPGRFFSGWLTVEIRGRRPELLLNLALSQGLELKEVRWLAPGLLQAQLTPETLRRLRPLTRRARCRLKIRRKRGLPFLLRHMSRRPLLPLAVLLFIPLLAFLSSIVAEVTVTSPYQLDPREEALVYDLAREAGVRAGRSRWAMDLEAAENTIMRGFPRLLYTEILRHGNRLEISVVRRVDVAEEELIRPAGDLVASAPGVIVDALVQRGTAQVSAGDTVRRGQVLISGEFAGDYLGAVGIVTALVYAEGYGECYQNEVDLLPTGRSFQQVRLAPAGAEGKGALLLGDDRHYLVGEQAQSRRRLCLWRKIPLPVEIILIEVAELDPAHVSREAAEARRAALETARGRALQSLTKLSGGRMLEAAVYTDQLLDLGDGVSRARSVARAKADIGSFRPLSETELEQWELQRQNSPAGDSGPGEE